MFTGDPGRPGLPGIPGSYTIQIPHRVQKRDAGKFSQMLNHKKMSTVTYSIITAVFFPSIAENKVVGRRQRRHAHGG